eukprot:3659693-Lingulodinium_polyedra.AAC.1
MAPAWRESGLTTSSVDFGYRMHFEQVCSLRWTTIWPQQWNDLGTDGRAQEAASPTDARAPTCGTS